MATSCVLRYFTKLTTKSAINHVKNTTVLYRTSRRLISSTNSRLADRKYSDKHEWVQVNGNVGTIGITDYAQESLGDIVYAQLPDIGTEFAQMDECGALESVKAASELYSPLSGTVVETNSLVEDQPGLINKKCYDEGWLFKMEMSKPSELDDLFDEAAYAAFVKQEQE